jgi:sugar lactone lactonase YvrE
MLRRRTFVLLVLLIPACRSATEPPLPEPAPGPAALVRPQPRAIPASGPVATTAPAGSRLQEVATFEHQVTGVAVSEDERVFVCFPRWTEDVPVSVAEVRNGEVHPYPDAEWNAWRNAYAGTRSPAEHFVCVQSVVADGRGSLWALDPAAPALGFLVPGGPKLVRIDLATDRVAEVLHFDERAAPQGSYLNDVRFSPDGRFAYVTDSGARGALVVVDLATGAERRVLDGHPSTQAEEGVVVTIHGEELRHPDGRTPRIAADGIALSPDGRHLYWQALTGRTLYRVPTEVLHDPGASVTEVESLVERVGENGVADGLLIDPRGRMYVSALQEDAIKVRDGEELAVLLQDPALRWPDTFALGPDGALYVTASRIHDMAWFRPGASPRLATQLFRIAPAELGRAVEASSPKR